MRQAMRTAEGYFNSDRMVIEYYNRLYKPIAHGGAQGDEIEAGNKSSFEAPNQDAWTYSNIK